MHYSPTRGHFAIELERAQASFLVFSLCLSCAAVCGGFFADLAKQWRKIVAGFLRLEESIFPFFSFFLRRFLVFSFHFTGAHETSTGVPDRMISSIRI